MCASIAPISASADTLSAGGFTIKAESNGFQSERGGTASNNHGETPPVTDPLPGSEDLIGAFNFTMMNGDPSCAYSNIDVAGDVNGVRINPNGESFPLIEGLNPIGIPGNWEIQGTFNELRSFEDDLSLESVNEWKDTKTTSAHYAFAYTRNLKTVKETPDTLTDVSYMFVNSEFNDPLISNWDMSNVTKMDNLFHGASKFNQDISRWDTSQVTNMFEIFSTAWNFDQPLNEWDTSNVTDMAGMFSEASKFDQDISDWSVEKAGTNNRCFSEGSALASANSTKFG